jgi:UDP-N-acetylglucosamine--N-acetylmuramyl-(pentapeptide) pyrophosphoryl-undecaprenol N-acetylglucosamine transferase
MDKIRIVLTGGHAATTGIAVIEEIRNTEKLKDAEIYWIGSLTAIEGTKISTMESRVFPRIGVVFIPIIAGKIQTKFTRHTIPSILKIPIGFVQAFWFLVKTKPKVVLSFGGYSSFPVVFWSWLFRVPVILHEQTVAAGRASISSAFFATKIALAREQSQKYFPRNKSIVTGNPLMTNILSVKQKPFPSRVPIIFVIGGSRGSNFINELIIGMAKSLLARFMIIQVTGAHDFERVEKFREKLPAEYQENYKTYLSIDPLEIGNYYAQADIIISRSGANSISEILCVKRPAILIPLPRTFMGEQVKNAKYAESFGFASVFLEKEATAFAIINEINRIFKDWQRIEANAAETVSPDINASQKVVKILLGYI